MTVQEQKEDPLHLFALIFFLLVSGLRKRELPKLVYHYTNVHGAFGIIDNSRLWSTGAYVMNDLREIEYGIDLLTSNIKGIRSKTRKNKRFTGFLNQLEAFIKDPAGRIERINSIFITSFCEARDALRQWRAYSGGGDGYCLAFDPSQMESLTVRQAPDNFTVDLVKVEYSPQKQNELLSNSLKNLVKLSKQTMFMTSLTKQVSHGSLGRLCSAPYSHSNTRLSKTKTNGA